jgi:hypothetical protein
MWVLGSGGGDCSAEEDCGRSKLLKREVGMYLFCGDPSWENYFVTTAHALNYYFEVE